VYNVPLEALEKFNKASFSEKKRFMTPLSMRDNDACTTFLWYGFSAIALFTGALCLISRYYTAM